MLVERTEGWPAALVLAWLWLRTVEDPARAVRAFGGDHRFVADYLSSEVLAALDEDDRAFLHGAAVLGEFTAELCDGVLDRTDSAARLAELEHSNLFISRLGTRRLVPDPLAVRRVCAGSAADARRRARRVGFTDVPPSGSGRAGCRSRRSSTRPRPATISSSRSFWSSTTCALIRGGAGTDASALGSDAAGRADRRASGACGGGRHGRDAGSAGARSSSAGCWRSLIGPAKATTANTPDGYVEAAARLVRAVTIDRGVRQAVLDGRRAVELAEADAE